MTCQLTSSTKHHRLQRKLDNLCIIVERMFDASLRPVASLKEHIARLEDLIVELPDEQSWVKLVDQYRDIAMHFWQRFEKNQMAVPTRSQPNKSTSSVPSSPLVSNTEPPVQSLRKEVKPKLASCSPPPLPPFRRAVRDGNVFPPRPYYLVPIPPPTDEIRNVLKQAFDQLDRIESVAANFEATKELLLMITKARAITIPYWKNVDLLSNIFGWAYSKLPNELRVEYRKQHRAKKKRLFDLRNFIQVEIDRYTMQLLMDCKAPEDCATDVTAAGDVGPVKRKACFYCKLSGHISLHCPVLKSTLCVKCLEFGHSDVRCPNGLKYVRLEDFQ